MTHKLDFIQKNERRDTCEWCPEHDRPCRTGDKFHSFAEMIVGANGEWRLCCKCAALPQFRGFKVRKSIREAESIK